MRNSASFRSGLMSSRDPRRPVSKHEADRMIHDFLATINSPRSLGIWLLYEAGEHKQLVEMTLDPHSYNCPFQFRDDYVATKLLSKCRDLKTGIDTDKVAIQTAEEAEELCRQTNVRLRQLDPDLDSLLLSMSRIIARILGPVPHQFDDVGWSPGRTSSCYGDFLSPVDKYRGKPDVSPRALSKAMRLLNASPLWPMACLHADGPCSVLKGALRFKGDNNMLVVPKNAKTGRVICYEPHLNIRLQLGVGQFIRRRLAREGVDLNNQSINRDKAALASRLWHLATIDLKMASDTLSTALVEAVLPVDWVNYLDDLRSPATVWPDKSIRKNQKFSSMGNGFTFELESLIFYAAARAVVGYPDFWGDLLTPRERFEVSVFGDDIIVPTSHVDGVYKALSLCGFVINKAKSFSTSYFRESCGVHAFNGVLCNPVSLTKVPNAFVDVLHFHNRVHELNRGDGRFGKLLLSWRSHFAGYTGPSGYGDGHYHVRANEEGATVSVVPTLEAFWVTTWTPFYLDHHLGDELKGVLPEYLYAASLCAALGPKRSWDVWSLLNLRRRVGYRKSRIQATSWPGWNWM